MNILYIEDNELDRRAFARLCERWEDICCWQSYDLGEAKRLASRFSIEVIFTDYFLDNFSALEVKEVFTSQLIVLLTGLNDEKLLQSIQDERIPFVLAKPPKAQTIRNTLDHIHQLKQNTGDLSTYTHDHTATLGSIDFTLVKQLAKGDAQRESLLLNSFITAATQCVEVLKNHQRSANRYSLIHEVQAIQQHLNLFQLSNLLTQAQFIEQCSIKQQNVEAMYESLKVFISQLQQTIEVVKQEIYKRQFV